MNSTMKKVYKKIRQIFCPSVYVSVSTVSATNILNGKTVVVTGGSSGIGYEIAKKCLQQGAKVAITGKNERKLYNAESRLKEYGDIWSLCWDIGDIRCCKDAIHSLTDWGQINCWVNNAGMYKSLDYTNCCEEDWDKLFNVNLKGPYFATNEIIRYFLKNDVEGNIVNITSEIEDVATTNPYAFCKIALSQYTKGLAYALCPRHIRVNAVAPGGVVSEISGKSPEGDLSWPMLGGRLIRPEEIAEVVVFLLSDVSKCINGEIVNCNEGNTLGGEYFG